MRFVQDANAWYRRNIQIHGPAILLLAAIGYIAQASRDPFDSTLFYVGQYEFNVDPDVITETSASSYTPWTIKFVFGLIADNLPIFGYNYRPYMFITMIIGILSQLAQGLSATTPNYDVYAIAYVTMYWYGAIVDCLGDALIIKSGKKDEEDSSSGLQSISWFSYGFGGAICTLIASQMSNDPNMLDEVNFKGARNYSLIATVFPILLFITLIFVKEERTKFAPGFKSLAQQFVRLFVVVLSPPFIVLRTAIWIILSGGAQISLSVPLQLFITNELSISPAVQGYINVASYGFLAIGTAVYYKWFRHTSFRRIFFATQLILGLFYQTDLILVNRWNANIGFADEWFIFTTGNMENIIGQLNSMPFLVMAGQLCPDGMEATFFALMMSVSNQGTKLAKQMGAIVLRAYPVQLGEYGNLPWLIDLRTITTIGVLVFFFLIPDTSSLSPANAESLKPTNPYIIKLLKFADMYNPNGDAKVEQGKEAEVVAGKE